MGFKENLKNELSYSGMLVKELSALSGINRRTIDNYLSTHNCTPSVEAAVSIAQTLGVSVEYLVTGEEPQRDKPISSLSPVVRSIIHVTCQLAPRDRIMVLDIAKLLKNRADEEREAQQDKQKTG
ncbi:MAG: helix-turn-helix domain-containing protein [Treponema sp.]|nr:helix-turn-helix domain-containing protein [Treponema sp.]